MVSDDVARGRSLGSGAQSRFAGGGARIASALRRYTLSGLMRGLWVRRRFTRVGLVECRGGRPLPYVQNRGRLTAENIGLWSGVRLEVGPQGHLSIGKGTYLNRNVTVICDERVDIGADCAISWDVVIMDSDQHQRPGMGADTAPVRIQDGVWIGCRAIVLKGVTIGQGAVIGAGAIVTRDIPPYSVAVGQPARVIRTLPSPTKDSALEAAVGGRP